MIHVSTSRNSQTFRRIAVPSSILYGSNRLNVPDVAHKDAGRPNRSALTAMDVQRLVISQVITPVNTQIPVRSMCKRCHIKEQLAP